MYGRDATRNAVSLEKNPPLDWQIEETDDAGKVTAERNVRWKAELGNMTFGAPAVAGGLVWVCTNTYGPNGPWNKPDSGRLMCFNERDGKFRWQYLTPRTGDRFHDSSGSVGSTPMVEGERLWFITNEWEVVCLDIGPLLRNTGEPREIWKLDMPRDLKVSSISTVMGPSMRCRIGASYKGMIYVITGNGVDGASRKHVPAPDAPSLVCLDKDTGKVVWQDNSPGKNILWGQWSSPLVAEINGRAQVIAPEGDSWVRSFDAMTGKLIWSFDANPKSSTYGINRNLVIAVPVLYDNRVYVATGEDWEHSTGSAILWCIDPTREGDISEELDDGPLAPLPNTRFDPALPGGPRKGKPNPNSGALWKFDKVDPRAKNAAEKDRMNRTIGSVAAADGLVIATDYAGIVHCLDARTGKQQWAHDLEAGTRSSPLICDGNIYVTNEDGQVCILALSREEKLLASHDFSSPIYCSPILANGVLYVATRSMLYAIRGNAAAGHAGEWPQWRGPDRSNVSRDTGLLSEWPADGPPLVWKAQGLGEGVPSVAVARQVVYTLGYHDGSEFLTALDAATGNKVWDAAVGPAVQEMQNMRWLSQRTPTVDDDRIYVMRARGDLVCLSTAAGKEIWRKNYITDFEGKPGSWGDCDFPLVDGDRLICTPGGKAAAMVALDKHTGALLWKCPIPDVTRSTYSTVIVAEICGVRQYIQQFDAGAAGISTEGVLLWESHATPAKLGNVHTAIVSGDTIFCSAGWGGGDALIKLTRNRDKFTADELYHNAGSSPRFDPWLGNSSLVGEHVYINSGGCVELKSGAVAWDEKLAPRVTMVVADGNLYYRHGDGTMVLAMASPDKYVEKGRFLPPRATKEPAWTSPVIAGGRLYLRDQDELLCYDLRKDRSQPFPSPTTRPAAASQPTAQAQSGPKPAIGRRADEPIFVPTPQDVVEKMLEVAAVTKDDVVYDLGCGDGRIVVTAARKYGCRAVGFDIDPECVRLSRENVARQDVGKLVDIAQKDVFTLDLSGASVVTLYMGKEVNSRLIPQLANLKPGSRIISHEFDIDGYVPDKTIEIVSAEDGTKHVLYLWTVPLKKKGE